MGRGISPVLSSLGQCSTNERTYMVLVSAAYVSVVAYVVDDDVVAN